MISKPPWGFAICGHETGLGAFKNPVRVGMYKLNWWQIKTGHWDTLRHSRHGAGVLVSHSGGSNVLCMYLFKANSFIMYMWFKCSKAHLKHNQSRCNFKMFISKYNLIYTNGSMYLVHCIIYFMKCLARASVLQQRSCCQWLVSTGLHQLRFSNVTFMWVLLSIQKMYFMVKPQMETLSNLCVLIEETPVQFVSSSWCWVISDGQAWPVTLRPLVGPSLSWRAKEAKISTALKALS